MVFDGDYREAAAAAVDTAYSMTAQGADTPGNFKVPSTASRLTEIRIGIGSLATDVMVEVTSAVKLGGTGIKIGSGYFVGPMMVCSGAATKSDAIGIGPLMRYRTNIPVVGGGEIEATGYMHGTIPTTGHITCQLIYDGIPGRIVDSDYREQAIGAAANTLTSLIVRGNNTTEGDFKTFGGTIGEIIFGAAPDPTGDTAGVNVIPALHLSGPGLMHAGNYKFLGPSGTSQADIGDVSGAQIIALPERYECPGIRTKGQNTIRAEAQNIESISAASAICGICYV